jgi:DNA-binding response OmpR family regulator
LTTGNGRGVRLAATGTGGVPAVRRHSPDIVILDFGLPDISGLEVIGRIRSFSNVYILMLTGREDLSETLMSAGANAVMTKPFRPRTLTAHVEETLGLQHQEHQDLTAYGVERRCTLPASHRGRAFDAKERICKRKPRRDRCVAAGVFRHGHDIEDDD